jgi:two-component system response regulator FixJ
VTARQWKSAARAGRFKRRGSCLELTGDERDDAFDPDRSLVFFGACHQVQAAAAAGHQVRAFVGAQDFQVIASRITAGVLILDMRMPGVSGLELQGWLIDRGYRIPIVFISGESQSIEIIDALKLDAVDFLIKPFALPKLLEAVEKAFKLGACIRQTTLREPQVRLLWSGQTPREREVCHLMKKGYANREIAEVHQSLPDTVKQHRRRVLEKMQIDSLPALLELLEGFNLSSC